MDYAAKEAPVIAWRTITSQDALISPPPVLFRLIPDPPVVFGAADSPAVRRDTAA